MTQVPLTAVPPAELVLDCRAGEKHRLRWANGALTTPDHPDATRERALAALGADPYPCLDIADQWQRHSDDLEVLVLASRGPGDQLADQGARPGPGRAHTGRPGAGWTSYAPMPARMPRRYSSLSAARSFGGGHHHDEDGVDVGDLLALGSGLGDRLVATVIATWVERIARADESVRSALPSLHVALYGRAVLAVRTWLGEPAVTVRVQMVPADAPRLLVRDTDNLRLEVPFAWLLEVWASGLTTVLGRFCLQADLQSSDRWELATLGPDLGNPRTIRIDAPVD